ncbi:hypothetical protein tpqmel_1048, partial [Candidatus Gastranaerophilus sp. (ex Termes propinquus)]
EYSLGIAIRNAVVATRAIGFVKNLVAARLLIVL